MNPKLLPKGQKPLSNEQKTRYRRSVLRTEIRAITDHLEGVKVLRRLAVSGCDVALLWQMLEQYRLKDPGGHVKNARQEMARFRRNLAAVAKKLAQVSKMIASGRDSSVSAESKDEFEYLQRKVDALVHEIERGIELLGPFSNSRGALRPEQYLYSAAAYLRDCTGRQSYREIATVLECLDKAQGGGQVADAENIRRTCERYLKGVKDREKAPCDPNRLIQSYKGDELVAILREEILTAVFPSAERRGRSRP